MNGVREFRLEKSHLRVNGRIIRCPLTEKIIFAGSKKQAAQYARQRRFNLIDCTRPEIMAGFAPADAIEL
jgi:hypothetical protein